MSAMERMMSAAVTGIGKQGIVLPSRPSLGNNACVSGNRRLVVISQVRVEDMVEMAQNKVLAAVAVSGAIGQLAKPFTRVFLSYKKEKKDFDPWAAIESGGFPSSHSSAVTATATSILRERGFADSIFGLSLIYAAIAMYDSQGVRREIGKHARVLHKKRQQPPAEQGRNSLLGTERDKNCPTPKRSDGTASEAAETREGTALVFTAAEEEEEEEMIARELLKERVGHTELEVVAGSSFGHLR